MSLLAGFDFLTEISNETLLELLQKNVQLGGVPVIPPFELDLPLSGSGVSANAHLIANDIHLDLNANDTITLTIDFDRTSFIATSPLPVIVCPLNGNLQITVPLQMVSAGGTSKQVSLNMPAATVWINWSTGATQEIANDLAGTPVSPDLFKNMAVQGLTSYIRSIPSPAIPLAFNVIPGVNGTLTPNLQFEKLEVHCIPNPDRRKQALGLFGILLAANDSNGNHNQKGATAITAVNEGVCISISPQAFHALVFCPAIAKALNTGIANLPATCGAAGAFETQGVKINNLSDSFANGHIDLNGGASKSGTCYDANGTFHGTISFTVSGSKLTPIVNMDEPDIDVSIPWYCWLAAAFVLGPIGIALAAVASTIGDKIASSLAGDALKNALGGGIPGISLGGLSGANFSSVNVTAEGLNLQGRVHVYVPQPSIWPMLQLGGSVITTNSQVVSSGIFHTRVWCLQEEKDYPYTESVQDQRGTYHVTGTLVSQPLTPAFSLSSGPTTVFLNGNSGTIELPNVNVHYPMPLATGGTGMQKTVHIGYQISGTSVQLTNDPREGNYSCYLNVICRDCNGNAIRGEGQYELNAYIRVQFEGDHVEIYGGYSNDVQYCAEFLAKRAKEISKKYSEVQHVPIWQQVNYPPEERVIEYIRDLVASGLPEADDILVASKIAHGNSFYRAIFSPAASQPELLKGRTQLTVDQQQLGRIASELSNLSEELQATEVNRLQR